MLSLVSTSRSYLRPKQEYDKSEAKQTNIYVVLVLWGGDSVVALFNV